MSLSSLNRATLTATFETTTYTQSVSAASKLARIGGLAKYCLIWVKSWSHSSFHPARLASLRMVKYGFKRSLNRETNRPRAANRLVSCYTPFLELGAGDSKMA